MITAAVFALACFTACSFDSYKNKDNSELSIVQCAFLEKLSGI